MSSLPAAKRSHPALANALYPLVNEWGAGAVLRALADCIEAQAPDYDHDVEAKQACKRTIALANWMDFNL